MSNGRFILFIAAILFELSACKNNDEVFQRKVSSYFTVVNASADTLNYYLNGTRQNNTSSLFPGGSLVYLTVPAGAQNYQFKKAGNAAVLFSVPLTLKDSTFNSLYITGETADKAYFTNDPLLVDTLPNIATVRFVNVAPDAGSLSFSIGDTVLFTGQGFKSSSVFSPVGSGLKEVKIFQTGSAIPKIDTVITMNENRAYTLFAKGLLNGKGSSVFDVGIVLSY